ncbi:hypothetical protein [Glaciecola sp. 1036]|uniref:hypothetical protein n=1 Tax=Alteromonadaceae TaxID=72275 RepID=UPI003CFECBF2
MKLMICAVLSVFSVSCFAQEHLNIANLFTSTNSVEKSLIEQEETSTTEVYVASPARVEAKIVSPIDATLNKLLAENPSNLPIGDHYDWRHLNESNLLENAYIPEFKVGFRQKLAGAKSTFYSVGIALIRPSDKSLAWNVANTLGDRDQDSKSTFLSLSLQSQF